MVKVTKWDRKKKKEDRAKYRNEQAKIKYKISENMVYSCGTMEKPSANVCSDFCSGDSTCRRIAFHDLYREICC